MVDFDKTPGGIIKPAHVSAPINGFVLPDEPTIQRNKYGETIVILGAHRVTKGAWSVYPAMVYSGRIEFGYEPGFALQYMGYKTMAIIERRQLLGFGQPGLNKETADFSWKILKQCVRQCGLDPESANDRKSLLRVFDDLLEYTCDFDTGWHKDYPDANQLENYEMTVTEANVLGEEERIVRQGKL